MPKLVIIRGLPGSGKSTLAKSLKMTHFETDSFFYDEDGVYRFNPRLLGLAHQRCFESVRESLKFGVSTLVSNTFTTLKELKTFLDMAKDLGVDVEVIRCVNNFGSIHNVPEETMDKMKKRFQDFPGEQTYNYYKEN